MPTSIADPTRRPPGHADDWIPRCAGYQRNMLWTILIVLAIVALALYIIRGVRA
jgi:hypothetical protein